MQTSAQILVPISAGELIDKITILRIKSARFTNPSQLHHVSHELTLLERSLRQLPVSPAAIDPLISDLQQINEQLWDVEDRIRICDRARDFGPNFIELARSIYQHNDRRCVVKSKINQLLGSTLVEEKNYRGSAVDHPES